MACRWTIGIKPQWNLNRNSCIFIHENVFENVIWKMVAILSRPRCFNSLRSEGWKHHSFADDISKLNYWSNMFESWFSCSFMKCICCVIPVSDLLQFTHWPLEDENTKNFLISLHNDLIGHTSWFRWNLSLLHKENWSNHKEILHSCHGMCRIPLWLERRCQLMYFNQIWNLIAISLVGQAPGHYGCLLEFSDMINLRILKDFMYFAYG